MNKATQTAVDALKPVIAAATTRAVHDAATGLDAGDAAQITHDVAREVGSVIVNQTNNEPWWQSRVTLGALLAGAAGVAGILGYTFPEDVRGQIVDAVIAAGPIIGAAITLYGRWAARKPLGQ